MLPVFASLLALPGRRVHWHCQWTQQLTLPQEPHTFPLSPPLIAFALTLLPSEITATNIDTHTKKEAYANKNKHTLTCLSKRLHIWNQTPWEIHTQTWMHSQTCLFTSKQHQLCVIILCSFNTKKVQFDFTGKCNYFLRLPFCTKLYDLNIRVLENK